ADHDAQGGRAAEAKGRRQGRRCRRARRQAAQRSKGPVTMTTLLIAEHNGTSLQSATLHTVTAAQKIGGEIHMLVAGSGAQAAAQAAAKIPGVAKVLHADAPHLAGF